MACSCREMRSKVSKEGSPLLLSRAVLCCALTCLGGYCAALHWTLLPV
jgi:hypothetical protein